MMAAGFNFNSIVDLGFVLLVTAVCIRSLTSSSLDGEKFAARWRRELRELEKVLRELILEAGNASASLDRRLLKRKTELESLLKRLEPSAEKVEKVEKRQSARPAARPTPAKPVPQPQREEIWELGELDELPNETWAVTPAASTVHTSEEEEELELEEENLGHLEELVESASDTLRISSQISQQASRARASHPRSTPLKPAPKPASRAAASTLSTQIEKIRVSAKAEPPAPAPEVDQPQADEEANDEIFRQLSIMDPTAYKIARRLLAAGTEIHVVARKLDLPVSEIRLMDRLMREEGEARIKSTEIGPNYKPTETVPRRKIVRDRLAAQIERRKAEDERSAARPEQEYVELTEEAAEAPLTEEMIDQMIERELALL